MGRFLVVVAACLSSCRCPVAPLSDMPMAEAEPVHPAGRHCATSRRTGPGVDRRRHGHGGGAGRPRDERSASAREHHQDPARADRPRRAANLDATVVGNEADTHVECNCAGIKPGRTYTARQLLDAVLLVSGNDAANTLADMLGGFDAAVAKMNAKAAALGAFGHPRRHAVRARRTRRIDGWTTPRDLAVIFRAAMANPVFAQITAQPAAMFPTKTGDGRSSTRTSCCTAIPARSAVRPASPTPPARRSSPPPSATAAGW